MAGDWRSARQIADAAMGYPLLILHQTLQMTPKTFIIV
jgi:hypothetical protein